MTSPKRSFPVLAMAASALRVLADIAFPPHCPSCRQPVTADGNFCSACYGKLRMISAPLCDRCGIPFVVMIEAGAHCPECLDTPPHFDKARAVMVYDAVSAPLISALKFHDQWAGVARHAAMMAGAGSALLAGADCLVRRKFNQSAVLAFAIAARSGVACVPELLVRMRATVPQMELDRATRLRNVKKAFAVPDAARVQGKIVVLVDDVITTGSTVDACARVLKKAGAKEVRVLALARTVKD